MAGTTSSVTREASPSRTSGIPEPASTANVGSRAAAGAPDRLVVARRNGYAVTRGRCRTCHRRVPSGLGDALLELPGERSVPPVSLSAEVQVFERNLERHFAERARIALWAHRSGCFWTHMSSTSWQRTLRCAFSCDVLSRRGPSCSSSRIYRSMRCSRCRCRRWSTNRSFSSNSDHSSPLESLRPAPCGDGAGGTSRRGCPTMTRSFWTPYAVENARQTEDVLLILTALKEGATLVTKDKSALARARRGSVSTMTIAASRPGERRTQLGSATGTSTSTDQDDGVIQRGLVGLACRRVPVDPASPRLQIRAVARTVSGRGHQRRRRLRWVTRMTVGIVLGASPTTAHRATAANNILIVTSLRQGFRPLANETITPGPRLEPSPSTLPRGRTAVRRPHCDDRRTGHDDRSVDLLIDLIPPPWPRSPVRPLDRLSRGGGPSVYVSTRGFEGRTERRARTATTSPTRAAPNGTSACIAAGVSLRVAPSPAVHVSAVHAPPCGAGLLRLQPSARRGGSSLCAAPPSWRRDRDRLRSSS
jgi:hypothetical protein